MMLAARAPAVIYAAAQQPQTPRPREYVSRRSRQQQSAAVEIQQPRREARPQRTGQAATTARPHVPSLDALLAAGVQWARLRGHSPEMKRYLLGSDAARRWRYSIFDVPCCTVPMLDDALVFLEQVAASGKDVLFVGVTPAARHAISIAAQRCSSPYVSARWVGGTLSNWSSIQHATALLDDERDVPSSEALTGAAAKKAAMLDAKRRERVERKFGGLRGLKRLPGALFVVDAEKHAAALAEAHTTRIPVVAICDSDARNPLQLAHAVPANAQGPAAVRLLAELAARAVMCGKKIEPPEAAWERDVAERGGDEVTGDASADDEFAFYGPWRVAPLRTSLSGTGRRHGHKRHRLTRGGRTGGALGRTQRRLANV